MIPLLLLIILLPFISILPIIFVEKQFLKTIQIFVSIIVFVLSILLLLSMSYSQNIFSLSTNFTYLGFNLGFTVTPITIILELMTSIVFLAASLGLGYFIKENERLYAILFALIQGASLALFLSSSLLLLYIFWEIAEFSMFFIIYLFGSSNKRYASIKFIVYSIISSLFLLIAILFLYSSITPNTFTISSIISNAATIPLNMQLYILIFFALSFLIKIPIFPFHTWLPDAHTEAPTTGSMVLAGVLLKFGGYGLILMSLMLPLFKTFSIYFATLFAISAIYSVLVAIKQSNLKRTIAYSSITDMAIISIGIASGLSIGTTGALFGMLAHAISISMLFLLAGTLKEAYGTLDIAGLKGLAKDLVALPYLFISGVFATVGIPLTIGFIADVLIFTSAYTTFGILGLVPLIGIVLLGGLFFWIIERIFYTGKSKQINYIAKSVIYSEIFLLGTTVFFGIFSSILIITPLLVH